MQEKSYVTVSSKETLKELIDTLKKIYCNKIGYDYRRNNI